MYIMVIMRRRRKKTSPTQTTATTTHTAKRAAQKATKQVHNINGCQQLNIIMQTAKSLLQATALSYTTPTQCEKMKRQE